MIDGIKRFFVSLFSGTVIVYTLWMLAQGIILVAPEYAGMNMMASI